MLDELIKVQEDFSSSIVTAEAVLNIAYVLEEEFQNMMKLFEEEEVQNKKLKPEYQSAIYLADLEDLSYKEISKILDKSMPQVKVLIHRARKALQKITRREEILYEE